LPPKPAILDWGGDTGLNTPLRQQARLHHVFDISGQPAVEGARSVSLAELAQHRYDLVVLSNVLEHVPQPEALLAQILPHLHEGLLYVEVPFESLMRQAQAEPSEAVWRRKRHWHEHINFFSVCAMTRLLERCGLRVVADVRIELDGGGYQMALAARRIS
jgi:predicted TPR repeat methyltransferase